MRVTLARYGGLAGVARPPVTVDDESLGETEKQELRRLISAASAAPAPPVTDQVRDGMSHAITVEGGNQPVELKQCDGAMSPEFAQLAAWLKRKARVR